MKFVRRKIKRDIKSQNAKIKIGIDIFGRIVHIGSKALLGWVKIANDFKFWKNVPYVYCIRRTITYIISHGDFLAWIEKYEKIIAIGWKVKKEMP